MKRIEILIIILIGVTAAFGQDSITLTFSYQTTDGSHLQSDSITIENLTPHIKALKSETDKIEERKEEILEAAEIRIKYKGYIERENMVAEKMLRLENIKIQGKFDYMNMNQITIEARQKLTAINPDTLAQASRIPGVSPSDINVLLVLLGR